MKNYLKVAVYISFLIQIMSIKAQTVNARLKIGDKVPDVKINNIINYSTNSAQLSSFKGKLLIIDFWATWCAPCIASFSKIDSLQAKYNDFIQILPVTYEDSATVSSFLNRLKLIKKISFAVTATSDKTLSQLFRHTTVPHFVWIDKAGSIIAITGVNDLNEKNIKSYLRNEKLDYTLKVDSFKQLIGPLRFAPSIQFKKGDNQIVKRLDTSEITIHSVLTKYIDAVRPMGSFRDGYLFFSNYKISGLYKTALYGNSLRLLNSSPSSLLVEVSDSLLYEKITGRKPGHKIATISRIEAAEWIRNNTYCYELKMPIELVEYRFKIMLDDLNRYFGPIYGIEGVLEKRINRCLALVRTSKNDKIESKGNERKIEVNRVYLKIQNSSLRSLINSLTLPLQKFPELIDETEFKGNVDIELNCELSDLTAVNKELSKYGLQFLEKEREMNVAIIREKKDN